MRARRRCVARSERLGCADARGGESVFTTARDENGARAIGRDRATRRANMRSVHGSAARSGPWRGSAGGGEGVRVRNGGDGDAGAVRGTSVTSVTTVTRVRSRSRGEARRRSVMCGKRARRARLEWRRRRRRNGQRDERQERHHRHSAPLASRGEARRRGVAASGRAWTCTFGRAATATPERSAGRA